MPPDPLSIPQAAARFRQGTLRPTELLGECLRRIDRYESRVRAWVLVDRQGASRAAEQCERDLAAGRDLGPLHGIPMGIKDIIDVEGLPTRAGSPLREGHVADRDAPLVAGLRRAGAVILGKTVTVEFACFDPPPTRNPWDPELRHTPGGSSSGSAAAVALGMCLGALGTQTGGSLVRPSSYCGISTCKPTFARLSIEGVVPVSFHLDHPGPMARTVADLEIMLRCLACSVGAGLPTEPLGRPEVSGSEGDLRSAPRRGQETRAEREETRAEPAHPRLGLVEPFFMERADPAVRQAVEAALGKLREGGATIEPVGLPEWFDGILDLHAMVMAAEAAAYHRRQFAAHRDQYGPMIAGLLVRGLSIAAVDYAEGLARLRHVRRHAAEMLAGFDALVAPATDATAPATLATTGPNTFQAPWSCSGLPVVSMPCGLAADGMPAAIQLVGRPGAEGPLLAAARWCERHLGFTAQPPLLAQEG